MRKQKQIIINVCPYNIKDNDYFEIGGCEMNEEDH